MEIVSGFFPISHAHKPLLIGVNFFRQPFLQKKYSSKSEVIKKMMTETAYKIKRNLNQSSEKVMKTVTIIDEKPQLHVRPKTARVNAPTVAIPLCHNHSRKSDMKLSIECHP